MPYILTVSEAMYKVLYYGAESKTNYTHLILCLFLVLLLIIWFMIIVNMFTFIVKTKPNEEV